MYSPFPGQESNLRPLGVREPLSDQRLRELERQWSESNDPIDARKYFAELGRSGLSEEEVLRRRLKAGDLTPDRVALCAYLGYEPARKILGDEAPDPPAEVLRWVRQLQGYPGAQDRAALLIHEYTGRPGSGIMPTTITAYDYIRYALQQGHEGPALRRRLERHLLPWALGKGED